MADWKLDHNESHSLVLIKDRKAVARIRWSDHWTGYDAHVEGYPTVRYLDLDPAKRHCEELCDAVCDH